MIEAKIVADSLAPSGFRLTTFVLTYPRFIHAEFMTHRVFSRNASSSRAIPVKKQIQMIVDNPAIPLAFTKNQKGMQGGEILSGQQHEIAVQCWLKARDQAVIFARALADLEVHKQYANRILEPFAHISVVCTATDFYNFFALRIHPAAQPEIQELARKMWDAMKASTPEGFVEGEMHLPFVTPRQQNFVVGTSLHMNIKSSGVRLNPHEILLRMSVARCARVSYLNHDGTEPAIEDDIELYNRLVGSAPIHASPTEHQAFASADGMLVSGNFHGWTQYRKTLQNENIVTFEGYKSED